jgi:endonuclease G
MPITRDEKLRRLGSYLNGIAPEGDLSELLTRKSFVVAEGRESAVESSGLELARTGLRQLQDRREGSGLSDEQLLAIEAIVLRTERPAVLIQNNSYQTPPDPWGHFGRRDIRQQLQGVIPSVAMIQMPGHPRGPHGGTGFVVGPDLVMTNRHVAEQFASGLGRRCRMNGGQRVRCEFRQEHANPRTDPVLVDRVLMIHPHWDMALLRAPGVASTHEPLKLSTENPEQLLGRDIAVIGYPAFDPRNDGTLQHQIFGGVYDVKRLQPGKLRARALQTDFYRNRVHVLTHDSSTLGGNSGSAVIDVKTGHVVGLHFAGQYMVGNYAVPTWELARDPHVTGLGVQFAGQVARGADWMAAWRSVESPGTIDSVPSGPPEAPPTSTPGTAPQDLSRVEPTSPALPLVVQTPEGLRWEFRVPLRITIQLDGPAESAPIHDSPSDDGTK